MSFLSSSDSSEDQPNAKVSNEPGKKVWLNTITFLGKTVIEAGVFGLCIIYLLRPKPYLRSQFATLSIRSEAVPAQWDAAAEKQKESSTLDNVRQQSRIGTELQPETSESRSRLEEFRRTTSSAVSIEPRESGAPFLRSESSEMASSSWEEPRLQDPQQLRTIEEQKIAVDAPEIQEMTTGFSNKSNVSRFAENRRESLRQRRIPQVPLGNTTPRQSNQVQALQSGTPRPSSSSQSQSETPKRRCSPCTDSVISCFQTTCNPLISRAQGHARTLYQSGPPSSPRAQTMVPFRSASTGEASTENIQFPWDSRPTMEIVEEYFTQPDDAAKEAYFNAYTEKLNPEKGERVYTLIDDKEKGIERQEKNRYQRENMAALARANEIDPYLQGYKCSLASDTPPEGGFSKSSSRDFRSTKYQENLPWQLRLKPNNESGIKPADMNDYRNTMAHSGPIAMATFESQQKELDRCTSRSKEAQEIGRERAVEVALKCGHLRVLPATFQSHNHQGDVKNVIIILENQPNCVFSADKDTVLIVKDAFQQLGRPWPGLEDSPISSSLPKHIFSIGEDNVHKDARSHRDLNWVGTNKNTNKTWPLKVLKSSIEYEQGTPIDMLFVNQDLSHIEKHYEVYDSDGFYLGKMNRNTMLLDAESVPFEDRTAMPKKDVT